MFGHHHNDELKSKEAWIQFYDAHYQTLLKDSNGHPTQVYSEMERIGYTELQNKRVHLKKWYEKAFPVVSGLVLSVLPGGGSANTGYTGYRFARKSLLHFGLIEASQGKEIIKKVVKDLFVDEVLLSFIINEIPIVSFVMAGRNARSIINKIVDNMYEKALIEHRQMIERVIANQPI